MTSLHRTLQTKNGNELEEAIASWKYIPLALHEPSSCMKLIRNSLCLSYLFARYTVPVYASHVLSSLQTWEPTDDRRGLLLAGVMDIVKGEIANNNVFLRQGECHSHYWDLLEAYQAAGGDLNVVSSFTTKAADFSIAIGQSTLWTPEACAYASHILNALQTPLRTFVLYPAIEAATPALYANILQNLSKECRFDKFRQFMQSHVDLDQGEHGPVALQWLAYYVEKEQPNSLLREDAVVTATTALNLCRRVYS